jgi:transketolase
MPGGNWREVVPATNVSTQTAQVDVDDLDPAEIDRLARQLSADSIRATTAAGSGHPTSCMSAAHIVATLLASHIRLRLEAPEDPSNDRLILSKGHAAPLLYAALAALDLIPEDSLTTLREKGSPLEGHPVPRLPHVPVATGSLGQGLANGLGVALGQRLLGSTARTWVIIGDSEMTEGSVWEAMALASHHQASGLTAIVDVNRLGQRGPTMYGWDTEVYEARARSFGWETAVVDGHDPEEIGAGLEQAVNDDRPSMLLARTIKGNGVSFLADDPTRHGKALSEEEAEKALAELDPGRRMIISSHRPTGSTSDIPEPDDYDLPRFDQDTATRDAFGEALATVAGADPRVVVLDAEVSDSTRTAKVKETAEERFFQLYIAEQAMVGVAVGLQTLGLRPVAATFGAFMTRAHDFIRMGAISRARMVLNGSHAGVSIGEDGPSQMGLDDIAMMRATPNASVLYPADGVSAASLLQTAMEWPGIAYVRTTREETPPIYDASVNFPVGGCHVLRTSAHDVATIVAAGITVHEALTAADELHGEDIAVRVIDAYSVEPLDAATIQNAASETGLVIVAEDHSPNGGLGDAVSAALTPRGLGPVVRLGVDHMPGSATPEEQRELAGISAAEIRAAVVENLNRSQHLV